MMRISGPHGQIGYLNTIDAIENTGFGTLVDRADIHHEPGKCRAEIALLV
jgi:hypothetical protein